MTQGCCAPCHGAGSTTGCNQQTLKVGLYSCETCNGTYDPVCPADIQGTQMCDSCCEVECGLLYAFCIADNPPYDNDIIVNCEDGFPYYRMYASWRSGDLRNMCLVPGGHAYILDAMPAASLYNLALLIPASMYMASTELTSDNTSAFVASSYDDVCGKPCTRTYGNDASCPQPCGLQDCGYPQITSSYSIPL